MSFNCKNLLYGVPDELPEELVETLFEADSMCVERIVSYGHTSPTDFWYDQEQDEWVLVLRGAARLRFADQDELVKMQPGDYLNIPAHQRHRIEWTTSAEPTVWLAIHYGPREKRGGSPFLGKTEQDR